MPNNLLSTQAIARAGLPILREHLVFPALVYNDYSSDFAAFGDTIKVRKPASFEAKDFNGNAIEVQGINEAEVLVKMDKIADVSFELTSKEMALNVDQFNERFLKPAMVALAEKINKDGLALYKDIPYTAGVAGTTPATLDVIAEARKQLNITKAPNSDRSAIYSPYADAKLSIIPSIVNAEKSGSTQALRECNYSMIFGW